MFNAAARRPSGGSPFRGHQTWSRLATAAPHQHQQQRQQQQHNNGYGRRRLYTALPNLRDVPPMTVGRLLVTFGMLALGYGGFRRFVEPMADVEFQESRWLARREQDFEIRERKARGPDTRWAVNQLLQASSSRPPLDWDDSLAAPAAGVIKAAPPGAVVPLRVSPGDAEAQLLGRPGVLLLEVDESWSTENFCAQILAAAGYPVHEHRAEDPEDGAVRLLRRLSWAVHGRPTVLLLRNAEKNREVAAAIQNTFVGPDNGVFVVEIQ